jgi:hypothetical protein
MARNGSGTYSNPYPNFVSGTVISSSEVDANNSDVATALTQSIAVDGQTTVTANLPMNAKKFTGLAVGAAATDSLNLGQAQAEAMIWCGTAGGSANAITLSPTPAITAYAAGQRFVWMASGSANTGATTVAISGLSTIALQDNGAALVAGNHAASKMFMGILNTTSTMQIMQVQSSGTDPLIISSLTVSGDALIGDDLTLNSDAAILGFGENTDVTLTHVHDAGLLLNSTRQIQFNDASQFIHGSSATVLSIGATDEIDLTATTIDINGTANISGVTTHGGNVVSDADSTDDLGTTGVRWAGTWTDAINGVTAPTAQYTSAEETKLAGIEASADVTDSTNVLAGLAGQVAVAATFEPTGDTSTGDNAAMGYTSVLGAILTGQGSTNDVTLVNDADATVLGIPTGTTNVTMAGALAVTGGITGVTALNGGQLGGRRNIIYNGAMNLAQRSASVTGLGAASGFFTTDRWQMHNNASAGRYTMAQVADGPPGFLNCTKLSCTTADTSIAAGELIILGQNLEGQDLQQIKKGTASAEQLTLSFWVKGNATATYVAELYDGDNGRQISKTFAVTTSWAKITLLIPADTTGAFDDDNANSLSLNIWLHAGATWAGGTLNSSAWAANNNANRAVGISSFLDATSRTFFITGVQMEIGATGTEFEHRTYGDELALCQRYYQKAGANSIFRGNATVTGVHYYWMPFSTEMRASPTMSVGSPSYSNATGAGFYNIATQGGELVVTISSAGGYAFIPWTAASEI